MPIQNQPGNRKPNQTSQPVVTTPKPTAQQVIQSQPEVNTVKWYKGDNPTLAETYAQLYRLNQTDPAKAQSLYSEIQTKRYDPSSMFYDPYSQATNSAIQELSNLGYDMSKGVTQEWFDQNAWLKNYYRTGVGGTPLSPTKTSTAEENAAYWYYQALNAETTTQKAEAEAAALKEEIAYWANRADRNYSDEEILNKINWKNYPTLVDMDADKRKGTPTKLNRAVDYNRDALIGWIWAARNDGGTGSLLDDAAYALMGEGNGWKEDPVARDKRKIGSPKFSPYSLGSSSALDDAALYFGRSDFNAQWLADNIGIMDGNDATAKKYYSEVYAAEQTTQNAETELANLWDEVDKDITKYRMTPDRIIEELQGKYNSDYKTLGKLDESMKSGKLVATTRAIDYRWQDVEAEINRRYEEEQSKKNVSAYTQDTGAAVGGKTGVTTDSDAAIQSARDKAIADAGSLIKENGTVSEELVFSVAYNYDFDRYVADITDSVNMGKMNPMKGALFIQDAADEMAKLDYFNALQGTKRYNDLGTQIEDAQKRLADLDAMIGREKPLTNALGSYARANRLGDPRNIETTLNVDGVDYNVAVKINPKTGRYEIDRVDLTYGMEDREKTLSALSKEAYEKSDGAPRGDLPSLSYVQVRERAKDYAESCGLNQEDTDTLVAEYMERWKKGDKELMPFVNAVSEKRAANEQAARDEAEYWINSELRDFRQFAGYSFYSPSEIKELESQRDALNASIGQWQIERTEIGNSKEYQAAKAKYDSIQKEQEVAAEMAALIGNQVRSEVIPVMDYLFNEGGQWNPTDYNNVYSMADTLYQMGYYSIDVLPAVAQSKVEYRKAIAMQDFATKYASQLGIYISPEMANNMQRRKEYYEQQIEQADWALAPANKDYSEVADAERQRINYDASNALFGIGGPSPIEVEAANVLTNAQNGGSYDSILTYGEAEMLLYLNANSKEEAKRYYDYVKEIRGYEARKSIMEEAAGAVNSGFWGGLGMNILASLMAPVELVPAAAVLWSTISGQDLSPNDAVFAISNFRNAVKETSKQSINDTIENPLLSGLANIGYDVGTSMLENVSNMMTFGGIGSGITNNILSSAVSAFPMSFEAGATEYQNARYMGASREQALAMAGASVFAEWISETIEVETIADAFLRKDDFAIKTMKDLLLGNLMSVTNEAIGEGISEAIDQGLEQLIRSTMYGLDAEEWDEDRWRQFWGDIGYAALLGGISGGLFDITGNVVNGGLRQAANVQFLANQKGVSASEIVQEINDRNDARKQMMLNGDIYANPENHAVMEAEEQQPPPYQQPEIVQEMEDAGVTPDMTLDEVRDKVTQYQAEQQAQQQQQAWEAENPVDKVEGPEEGYTPYAPQTPAESNEPEATPGAEIIQPEMTPYGVQAGQEYTPYAPQTPAEPQQILEPIQNIENELRDDGALQKDLQRAVEKLGRDDVTLGEAVEQVGAMPRRSRGYSPDALIATLNIMQQYLGNQKTLAEAKAFIEERIQRGQQQLADLRAQQQAQMQQQGIENDNPVYHTQTDEGLLEESRPAKLERELTEKQQKSQGMIDQRQAQENWEAANPVNTAVNDAEAERRWQEVLKAQEEAKQLQAQLTAKQEASRQAIAERQAQQNPNGAVATDEGLLEESRPAKEARIQQEIADKAKADLEAAQKRVQDAQKKIEEQKKVVEEAKEKWDAAKKEFNDLVRTSGRYSNAFVPGTPEYEAHKKLDQADQDYKKARFDLAVNLNNELRHAESELKKLTGGQNNEEVSQEGNSPDAQRQEQRDLKAIQQAQEKIAKAKAELTAKQQASQQAIAQRQHEEENPVELVRDDPESRARIEEIKGAVEDALGTLHGMLDELEEASAEYLSLRPLEQQANSLSVSIDAFLEDLYENDLYYHGDFYEPSTRERLNNLIAQAESLLQQTQDAIAAFYHQTLTDKQTTSQQAIEQRQHEEANPVNATEEDTNAQELGELRENARIAMEEAQAAYDALVEKQEASKSAVQQREHEEANPVDAQANDAAAVQKAKDAIQRALDALEAKQKASEEAIAQRQHEEENPVDAALTDEDAKELEDIRQTRRVLEREMAALQAWQEALNAENPVDAPKGDEAAAAMANTRADQLADKQQTSRQAIQTRQQNEARMQENPVNAVAGDDMLKVLDQMEAQGIPGNTPIGQAMQQFQRVQSVASDPGLLSRQVATLSSSMQADTASMTASIAAVLASGQQMTADMARWANAAAMHAVSKLGGSKAVSLLRSMLMTAYKAKMNPESVQNAFVVASLNEDGQANAMLGDMAEYGVTPEGLTALDAEAQAERADQNVFAKITQAVVDSRVAEKVRDLIADGAAKAIEQAQQAVEKAAQKVREVQANLKAEQDKQAAMTQQLGELHEQQQQNPGDSDLVGRISKVLAALKAQAQVVANQYQAMEKANSELQDAQQNQQSAQNEALTSVRQQAQTEVAQEIQQEQEEQAAAEQQRLAEEQAMAAASASAQETENINQMDADHFIETVLGGNVTDEERQRVNEMFAQARQAMAGENSKRFETFAKQVGKKFGVKVEIGEVTTPTGKHANGRYNRDTNTLTLSPNATVGDFMYFVAGHELTHIAESAGNYDDLASALLRLHYGKGIGNYREFLRRVNNGEDRSQAASDVRARQALYNSGTGKTVSAEYAAQELVADIMGDVLRGDQKLVDRLVAEEPTVARRIWEGLKNFLKKMVGIKGDWKNDYQRVVGMLEKALKEHAQLTGNETRYSIDKNSQGMYNENTGGEEDAEPGSERDYAGQLSATPGRTDGRGDFGLPGRGRGEGTDGSTPQSKPRYIRPDIRRVSERLLTPAVKQKLSEKRVTDLNLQAEDDRQRFSSALEEAKASNDHGAYVDAQSEEALEEKGAILVLSEDGMAGAAVGTVGAEAGNIFGVFKSNKSQAKRAVASLIIQAVAQGGNKLDCYDGGLRRMYASVGMIPVARVSFNEEFMPDDWNVERDDHPDIVFWMHNGDSAETIAEKYGLPEEKGGYHEYSLEEIQALPLFGDVTENGETQYGYDRAWAYRDQLLEEAQKNGDVKFNLPTDTDYMAAVESGDTETAQQMVDQSAQEAGYVLSTYHGTGEYFNTFEMRDEGIHLGDQDVAEQIADQRYNVRSRRTTYRWADIKDRVGEMSEETRQALVDRVWEMNDTGDVFTGDISDAAAVTEYVNEMVDRYENGISDDGFWRGTTKLNLPTFDRQTGSHVMRLYAKMGNPFVVNGDVGTWTPMNIANLLLMRAEGLNTATSAGIYSQSVDISGSDLSLSPEDAETLEKIARGRITKDQAWEQLADIMERAGYDGIQYRNQYEGDKNNWSYLALRPSDVKSADPVTYDDQGNVIPLSERFNQRSDDIRYSLPSDDILENMIRQYIANGGMLSETDVFPGYNGKRNDEPQVGQRQFGTQTAQSSNALEEQVRDYLAVNSLYDRDTNGAQIRRAVQWVQNHATQADPSGYYGAVREVLSPDFNYFSADGQAQILTVMSMAAKSGDIAVETELANAYNQQGTNIAQALQARRIFRLMTPEGRRNTLIQMQEDINGWFADEGKDTRIELPEDLLEEAENAQTEEDFAKVQRKANKYIGENTPPNWKDRLRAFRYFAMLFNPVTHIRNFLGNAAFMPLVGAKNKLGALVELTLPERTKTLGLADKDARAFAKKDAVAMRDELTGQAKYNDETQQERAKKPFGDSWFQKLIDFNSNLLEAEDWLFLQRHYRNALAGWMTANKVTSADFASNPDLLNQARAYAVEEAQKATYRDASKSASMLADIVRKGGVGGAFVEAIIPFKKTPINIMKRGLEYSPLGLAGTITRGSVRLARYINWVNNGMKGKQPEKSITPQQYIDRLASGLTGSGIAALGAFLAAHGLLKVRLGKDDEIEKQNGRQNYSFNIELFGHDISYTVDWVAPSSMPLFVGASIFDTLNNKDFDGDNMEKAWKVVDAFLEITEPVFNLSMLDGINSLLTTYSRNEAAGNTITDVFATGISNYVTSFMPTILGKLAKTIDTTRRETYFRTGAGTSERFFGGIWQKILAKTPGASFLLKPYVSPLGEAEESSQAGAILQNFISPGYFKEVDISEMEQEMQRLFEVTGEQTAIPKQPSKYFTVDGEQLNLNAEQYAQLQQVRGSIAKELLEQVVSSDEYKSYGDDAKIKMVKDAWTYATQTAKQQVEPDAHMDKWVSEAQRNPINALVNRREEAAKDEYYQQNKAGLFSSIDNNDLEAAQACVEGMRQCGKTNGTIKSAVTKEYKPKYLEAYKNNDDEEMIDIAAMLMNLDLGYKTDEFTKWIKEDADEE